MIITAGPSAILDRWRDIDPAELRARLRSAQAAARILAGPASAVLIDALRRAETDGEALAEADAALAALPSITRRRVLATLAATLPGEPARLRRRCAAGQGGE